MTNIVDLQSEFQTQAQSIEAEQAVLGAIMINNAAFAGVRSILRPEHFYEPSHGAIYAAMQTEIDAGRLVDAVTLRAEPGIKRDYLANMARAAVCVIDTPSYAFVIRDHAHRRQIAQICAEVSSRASRCEYETLDNPDAIMMDLRESLREIQADRLDDAIASVGTWLDRLEQRIDRKETPVPTGLTSIDRSLDGGLRTGDLYAIEAPAGSFKTGTLGTIALQMIKADVPMLFVTVEMDAENILARMVAAESGCNARHLMDASQCDESLGRVRVFKNAYGHRKAYFVHRPGITADGLAALCSAAKSKLGVQVIFVDYWQRIRGCGSRQSRAEFYEGVADWAADFAATQQVAVVMASQLNRQGDSFGSGGLERTSAWLARIHKIEGDDRFAGKHEVMWLDIAKSRYSYSGAIGSETNPAFRIDGVGPVLKEIGDWQR